MISKYKVGDIFWDNIKILSLYREKSHTACDYKCLKCNNIVTHSNLSNITGGRTKQCQKCRAMERADLNRIGDVSILFEDSNLIKYYWGLIYADGCIRNDSHGNKLNVLSINMTKKDEIYIQKLSTLIKTNNREYFYDYNINPMIYISVSDINLVPKLANLMDIHKRKTYNPPNPNNLNFTLQDRLSIVCGFVDGDGSRATDGTYNFKIRNHHSWFDMHKFMFDGLYSSCHIDSDNLACTNLSSDGFKILVHHGLKYNLPLFRRKWYLKS